mmetsp:Transcript_32360/g.86766  ORF Transcript_32360/g.86766 Transcript_32360/m.86766 type:complete len:300 (-) Transcript_32360:495-1394(-)
MNRQKPARLASWMSRPRKSRSFCARRLRLKTLILSATPRPCGCRHPSALGWMTCDDWWPTTKLSTRRVSATASLLQDVKSVGGRCRERTRHSIGWSPAWPVCANFWGTPRCDDRVICPELLKAVRSELEVRVMEREGAKVPGTGARPPAAPEVTDHAGKMVLGTAAAPQRARQEVTSQGTGGSPLAVPAALTWALPGEAASDDLPSGALVAKCCRCRPVNEEVRPRAVPGKVSTFHSCQARAASVSVARAALQILVYGRRSLWRRPWCLFTNVSGHYSTYLRTLPVRNCWPRRDFSRPP